MTKFGPTLLTPEEISRVYDIPVEDLTAMRLNGSGPKFSTVGPKIILYDTVDMYNWRKDQKRTRVK